MRSILLVLALAAALGGCTGVFFHPGAAHVRTPAQLGLAFEDTVLRSADGETLHAWWLPAAGPPRGTVLFLHGNAENISTHLSAVHWLPGRGFQVLLLDYRGYGRSTGTPTVAGALRDVDAAMAHLLQRPDVDAGRIALLGQSLGGSLAAWYAARGSHRDRLRAVVIDSAFSSYRDIAREKLDAVWWLSWLKGPAGWTIDDDFSPVSAIADIAPRPVLFIAGGRDRIVPAHHSERLFAAARAPKTYWEFPEAGHIQALHLPEGRDRLVAYLAGVMDPGDATVGSGRAGWGRGGDVADVHPALTRSERDRTVGARVLPEAHRPDSVRVAIF